MCTQNDYDKHARALAREALAELFKKNGLPGTVASLEQISEIPVKKTGNAYSLVDYIEQIPAVHKVVIERPDVSGMPDGFSSYYIWRSSAEGDIVRVVLLHDFNYCESRFYIAKELLHYCLDQPRDRINTMKVLDTVVTELIADDLDPLEGATKADRAARSGALEVLIPDCWMQLLIQAYKEAMSIHSWEPEATISRIAHILRVQTRLLAARIMERTWIIDAQSGGKSPENSLPPDF
jgi:hypothetical protein